jgi:hypothetical protein
MIESGDAENIMEMVLLENVGTTLDSLFFTTAAGVAGLSPPGILNGAISVTASSPGQSPMAQDIGKLAAALAPVSGSSQMVIVAAPAQAAMIKGVLVDPPPTYASNALANGTVVAMVPAAIASATGTPSIFASTHATIHQAAPAADLVISPSTVAAPQKSMCQTDSTAIRFVMAASWVKRGAGVAMLTGANWP